MRRAKNATLLNSSKKSSWYLTKKRGRSRCISRALALLAGARAIDSSPAFGRRKLVGLLIFESVRLYTQKWRYPDYD